MQSAKTVPITLIAALSKNRVIGNRGKIPWRLPEDIKHFRDRTKGHPLVMGRKTFETLPQPLPNRTHIVISRSVQDEENRNGVYWVKTLERAIAIARTAPGGDSEIFIAGGGQIYLEALPIATHLDLTLIDAEFDGDAFFPEWSGYGYLEKTSKKSTHEDLKYQFTVWVHPQRSNSSAI